MNRRGQLISEELFHVIKIALIILVVLIIIGGIATLLFKPDTLSIFG